MHNAAILCETRIGIAGFQNEAPPRNSIRALGSSTSRPLKLGHRSAVEDEQVDDEEEAAAVVDVIWFYAWLPFMSVLSFSKNQLLGSIVSFL
jgi:hypothetical protein